MRFEVAPRQLLEVLKRLMPRKKQIARQGPLVTIMAGGEVLVLAGQFDNSWDMQAKIQSAGSCSVDLIALIKSLQTYAPTTPLVFELQSDGLKFGTTKMKLHALGD